MSLQSSLASSMKKSNSYDLQNKSLIYQIKDSNIKNLHNKLFQACSSTESIKSFRFGSIENSQQKTAKLNLQIQMFKLRKQQNKAELMKIQFELSRRQKHKLKEKLNKFQNKRNIFNQSYAQNYRYFKQERQKQQLNQILNEDQDEQQNQQSQKQINSQKIVCYNQVKKHPKILDYTIQKINQITGQKHKIQQFNRRSLMLEKINKKQVNKSLNQHKIHKKSIEQEIQNPQSIIQKQKVKFYIKKNTSIEPNENNHNQISKSVRQTQQKIIKSLNFEILSKQSIGKIKGKFNQLIYLLQKNDLKQANNMPRKDDQRHIKKCSLPNIY